MARDLKNTVYLDTETTGLNQDRNDEMLEVAIVDNDKNILINTLVKPTRIRNWEGAQAIHGISPDDVKDVKTVRYIKDKIEHAIRGKDLVIYNAGYDVGILMNAGIDVGICNSVECAMLEAAEIWGEWNDYFESYTWMKLGAALKASGGAWEGNPHSALADTLACRHVWNAINNR